MAMAPVDMQLVSMEGPMLKFLAKKKIINRVSKVLITL